MAACFIKSKCHYAKMGLILSPDIEHTLLGIFSIAFQQKSNIATMNLNAIVDPLFICFNEQ